MRMGQGGISRNQVKAVGVYPGALTGQLDHGGSNGLSHVYHGSHQLHTPIWLKFKGSAGVVHFSLSSSHIL